MKHINFILCIISISLMAACGTRSNIDLDLKDTKIRNNLTMDAQSTYLSHFKSRREGAGTSRAEIPSKYWAERIKALNPIKVYTHRSNMVVVQRSTDNIEEGVYIHLPISSYLPHSGDDEFVFSPNPISGDTHTLGNGVFDFKRTLIQ